MTMDRSTDVEQLAHQVQDAESYGGAIDYLFDDKTVHLGHISVWYTFSKQLYTILPTNEREKMDYLFKKKWWELFKKGTFKNKCVLLVLYCTWRWW